MGNIGIWQLVIVVVIVVLLFGRGKISGLMGDVAQGIKSFKKGLADDEPENNTEEQKNIEQKKDDVVSEKSEASSEKTD